MAYSSPLLAEVTVATIGYGDHYPDYSWTVFVMLSGIGIFILLVGSLSARLQRRVKVKYKGAIKLCRHIISGESMSMIFCRNLLSLLVISVILIVGAVPFSSITVLAASATEKTTTTPIKHLVVIFQENVSFDHYFGTYPNAKNLPGETRFSPLSNTRSINGLTIGLLNNNTNLANPWRLDKSQVVAVASCDPNHSYTALQKEMNGGLMDKFVLCVTAYQDGHPGISDPIDEQNFLVNTINRLQQLPEWNSTAIIIAYDDSGGWYDDAMPPMIL